MKSRREQDYYLGLDIGTESVGYAVTDENYNILKFNGKNMWGSRLFDEAQTAAERRTFRSGRRRLQRRAWRIQLLQELFSEEISKVDQSFFVKMKESPLILTDKTNGQKYTLFNDDDYSDIDYYSEFPTIYHLRKALLMEDRKFDVRLLYLAVHHIVKHRGHFLFQGSVNNATSFHSVFDNLKICLRDEFEIELVCHSEEKIAEILKDKKKSKRDKCNEIFNELNVDKSNKQIKSIVTLITGMKAKVADIFDDESLLEIDKPSISFSESSYETLRVELEDVLGERCGVIDIIKCVYDWAILADILDDGEINGKSYLSVAKVNLYDKHKEDLRILKQLFKENHKVYKEFFVDEGKSNYCAYLNIVVGNVYFEKFTNNPLQWLKKNRNAEYSLNQMFNYDLIKNDKVIWKRGNNGTLRDVLKNINKRDIQYTQQVTTIKRGQNGGLFNQQLVGKDENASMPVKKGRDVNIYGGYKSITPAFFTLIESEDKKGNKQRSIESVPLFMKNQFLNDSNSCMEYFENVYGLKNPKVVISQIRKNTYLIIDDFPVLLRGSTGKQLILQCAVQLMVSQEQERYLKKLEKYIQKNSQRKDKKQNLPVTEYDGLTQESNIRIYDTFIDKLTNTIYSKRPANPVDKLKNKREIFEQLSVECQCIVLNEILHLFQCKPIMGADLSMLGEAKATGIITKNKIISTCNNVIIVNQSVTGLFKQETDLLNI